MNLSLVKNPWYWGPLPKEKAEIILANEPDGSFLLRDSSDIHHIFTISLKCNGQIRHTRIKQFQGSYGFSELLELRGSDIEDFINKTIKYSKSGEYTFFVNKKPAAGPTKVELLYPVSRFKTVWSLQKLCRYEILKVVRKDQVDDLPLPFCLKKFLLGPEY
ncbi:suppressor of cytokine signaling 7-like [Artemia franciscana]|uniref:Suppressor of cytokine signaling 7 n=1 Tax=Artemia franciscana TaxID=6661 RepID=A0AA88I990_ARTSF|nr:hypothetical protein QYM36_002258 [Artemia franciscana]